MRFSIGQKVRLIKEVYNSDFPRGSVCTVVETKRDICRLKSAAGQLWWVENYQIVALPADEVIAIPEVCCSVPLESIDITTTDYVIPKAECSVCGSIYMSDGSVLKNVPDDTYNIKIEEDGPDLEEYIEDEDCYDEEVRPQREYSFTYTAPPMPAGPSLISPTWVEFERIIRGR